MWTVAQVSVEGDSQEPHGVYLVDNVAIEANWRDGPVVFVTRDYQCTLNKKETGLRFFCFIVPGSATLLFKISHKVAPWEGRGLLLAPRRCSRCSSPRGVGGLAALHPNHVSGAKAKWVRIPAWRQRLAKRLGGQFGKTSSALQGHRDSILVTWRQAEGDGDDGSLLRGKRAHRESVFCDKRQQSQRRGTSVQTSEGGYRRRKDSS